MTQLENRSYVRYVVEAIWPKDKFGEPGVPDPAGEHWGRYNSTAWNDRRDPNTKRDGFNSVAGTFDDLNLDVAAHPSRIGKPKWDAPAFADLGAALAYAARLYEHGEVAARFSNGGTQADRDAHYLGRVIRTRVVERVYTCSERVVGEIVPAAQESAS